MKKFTIGVEFEDGEISDIKITDSEVSELEAYRATCALAGALSVQLHKKGYRYTEELEDEK